MRPRLLALLLVLLVALPACGGADDDALDEEVAVVDEVAEAEEGGAVEDTAGVEVTGELGSKPEVSIPDTEPPGELIVADLVEGTGEEAAAGATVTTHYVGQSWSTGEQFDSSWDRGEPISFPLTGVIPGWQEGIPGMRVGGRRLLVIPPEMAYGDNPPPGAPIAPGETLVFVIDLTAVE